MLNVNVLLIRSQSLCVEENRLLYYIMLISNSTTCIYCNCKVLLSTGFLSGGGERDSNSYNYVAALNISKKALWHICPFLPQQLLSKLVDAGTDVGQNREWENTTRSGDASLSEKILGR